MARQNFQHSKRQRDLAKKQKREEKQQRKAERKKLAQEPPQPPEGAPAEEGLAAPEQGPAD